MKYNPWEKIGNPVEAGIILGFLAGILVTLTAYFLCFN